MRNPNLDAEAAPLRGYMLPSRFAGDERFARFARACVMWSDNWDVGWADPLPSTGELDEFYCNLYREAMGKQRSFERYVASPNYRAQTRSQAEWIAKDAARSGDILDVGAGFGLFLWTARQALPEWRLHAVEPDSAATSFLEKLALVERDFTRFWRRESYEPAQFDAIVMSHVLEHLIDIEDALQTLVHYLKPGGRLLVETPYDPRSELLRPSRESDLPHLWFFGVDGLKRVVMNAGLQIERSAVIGVKRFPRSEALPKRLRRAVSIRLKGPLALLDDPSWYCEGDDRSDLRTLARKA